jgi:acetyl esterase/lipase
MQMAMILAFAGLLADPSAAGRTTKKTYIYKEADGVAIRLDVLRPDDARVLPVVVWIHGGALILGGRQGVPGDIRHLCLEEDYALVSIDYRLAPEVKVPEIVEDIQDAFRWIREKGPEVAHLDPERIVVTGGSAGGYLTLMTGICVKPSPTALVVYWGYGDIDGDWYTKPSPHYRTAIPIIKEAEIREATGNRVLTHVDPGTAASRERGRFYRYLRQNGLWTKVVSGFDPSTEKGKLDAYCPVRNITPEYPPVILVHGTDDTDVPYSKSADMARELLRHNVPHELVTVPDAGHGLAGGNEKLVVEARAEALSFIRKHLEQSTGEGIASKYPGDNGIEADADVIFADDFEAWQTDAEKPPTGTWNLRRNTTSRTHVIPGAVLLEGRESATGPGKHILEIACWTTGSGSQVGGLWRKLGNYNHAREGLGDGYEELYLRYYIKFDDGYRAVRNHGANLGGRDVTREGSAWVGMAGIRDVSTRGYFYSGVQPRGERGSRELEMGFYSYHLDKRGPWGENYEVQKKIPIQVGKWYCVERHLKLNSVIAQKRDPANPDGIEELWIDGQLAIRKQGVRFRRVPELHISFFSLETYYHGLPERYDSKQPIKVYFDNLVIAKSYIGPMGTKARP